MANYRYKAKITDDILDAIEIVKNTGKSIKAGHADVNAVLMNLSAAVKKLESANYFLDRE